MSKLLNIFSSGIKMRLYFFKKLPTLFFWRIRVEELNRSQAKVSIPYCRRTKNPFRSIYFGALAGAAELATGLLALLATEGENISMLVTGIRGEFYKKAKSKTYFVCTQGDAIVRAVEKAKLTGEGQSIEVLSKGYNTEGELIAEFEFTWSFKSRKK